MLRRLRESWGAHGPRPGEETRQIQQIGEAREPAALPTLLSFLYSRADEVAEAAARAIEEIIAECEPLELAELDWKVREVADWRGSRLTVVGALRRAGGLVGALGVLSFHSSGYVREGAVQELAKVRDGRELSFLLIRLNDWVRPVSDAAKAAVADRIRPEYAAPFVRLLPLVDRLRAQSREDHHEIVEGILALLRSEGCRPALREGLKATDRHTRRLAFGLLVEPSAEDQDAALVESLSSDDTVIRLGAVRELRRRLDGPRLNDALERLWHDRFMPVRREALYGFVEKLPDAAPRYLTSSLLDPHVSMREAARFYLRQLGEADFARFYRDRLDRAEGDELAAAVAGLGETGAAEDAHRLARFLDDPSPRVRRAAVRAIGHLDPEGFTEQFLTALRDTSARVAKAARDTFLARHHLLSAQQLWSAFQASEKPQVRRIILSLVGNLTWGESAPLLVLASGSSEEEVRNSAVAHLRRWSQNAHRLSVRPSSEQLRRLDEALRQHPAALGQPIRDDLNDVLSYARRQ